MLSYNSVDELVKTASQAGRTIAEIVLEDQAQQLERPVANLVELMKYNLDVMREAAQTGLQPGNRSASGLSGGNAYKLKQALSNGQLLGGEMLNRALIKALAVSEVNACMGRIVAAPTAGSCGIIPAVLLTVAEEKQITESQTVMGLFTAAGIGLAIAKQASISGAEGGCQAECGSASAMAAAAAVEMVGGTPIMAANATAFALKNVMGLICDPVAGLVEVPCVKRNGWGAASALVAANMALAGIDSVIPADEVIMAMKSVGNLMVTAFKETAEGGLAATPTGKKLAAAIFDSGNQK
ncbi:MAG: L-serine ammonia-lyase, iron-sulfur-dependent, subunit alpha [Bacillota bacterium]